jgi:hypothetical protein
VARDFDLHIIDPITQAPAQPYHSSGNGDQAPLVESLLQALNTLVDRLNQAEATVESQSEHERKP